MNFREMKDLVSLLFVSGGIKPQKAHSFFHVNLTQCNVQTATSALALLK